MKVIPPLAGHELLLVVFQFALLLLTARTLGEIAVRLKLPAVVGELLSGFVIGPTLLGNIVPGLFETIFPQTSQQMHLIEVISWLGVIMLLIVTGLETDTELIVRKGKGAAAISIGGMVIPFLTGLALGFLLPVAFVAKPDQRLVFALFIGTAMSISAIPVIAKILMDMDIIRRDIGQITLAAGMIDDTAGWILLSVVAGLASSGKVSFGTAGKSIVYVALVVGLAFTVGRRVVSWTMRILDTRLGGDMVMITGLMVIALLFGTLTHLLHLEAVLGAFIAGILVGEVKRFDRRLRHIFEQLTLGVFAPVFFALSGIRVNLIELARPSVLLITLVVLAVAILGKFVGVYAGARVSRLGHWEGLALGAAMNARGAIEIIVATIGLSLGVLTLPMYTIILMISIVTSIMAPPLLRLFLNRMEFSEEEEERLEEEERREDSFVANLKRVLLPSRGGANSQVAAQLLGMMVAHEEIEVTRLHVHGDGQPAAEDVDEVDQVDDGDGVDQETDEVDGVDQETEQRLARIADHFEALRTLERSADGKGITAAVLEEARQGYDLLVLGATGRRGGEAGPLFRGDIDAIIQDAPCPLMVVAASDEAQLDEVEPLALRHIVLPVDGSEDDRLAAEVAFSIARDREIVVDVLHVFRPRRHTTPSSDDAVEQAREMGEDVVNRIAEVGHAMGATVHTDVLAEDNQIDAILDYSRDRADLLVVASQRRPVSQRAFFGHATDMLLREAPCPVVVVSS